MKNKYLIVVIAVFLFIALCALFACAEVEQYDIVCTIFPQFDFCRELVGDELSIKMLLPAGTDAHSYELTTRDKSIIKNCKLFIYIGGESEKWVNDVIESTDLNDVKLLNLSEHVDLINNNSEESVHEEHNHSVTYDEHIWLSVKNAVKMCRAIYGELKTIFSPKKEYEEKFEEYVSKLVSLDSQYINLGKLLEGKTLFFADRFPFIYMTNEYGIKYESIIKGCSSDTLISPSEKIEFENKYKNSKASGVFVLENSDMNLAVSVTGDCGGEIYHLNSCQIIDKEAFDGGKTYIDIMLENLSVIERAYK